MRFLTDQASDLLATMGLQKPNEGSIYGIHEVEEGSMSILEKLQNPGGLQGTPRLAGAQSCSYFS